MTAGDRAIIVSDASGRQTAMTPVTPASASGDRAVIVMDASGRQTAVRVVPASVSDSRAFLATDASGRLVAVQAHVPTIVPGYYFFDVYYAAEPPVEEDLNNMFAIRRDPDGPLVGGPISWKSGVTTPPIPPAERDDWGAWNDWDGRNPLNHKIYIDDVLIINEPPYQPDYYHGRPVGQYVANPATDTRQFYRVAQNMNIPGGIYGEITKISVMLSTSSMNPAIPITVRVNVHKRTSRDGDPSTTHGEIVSTMTKTISKNVSNDYLWVDFEGFAPPEE